MDLLEDKLPYILVIAASAIVILSYFFNVLSERTKIPSVLMLIVTGMLGRYIFVYLDIDDINLMPVLEVLGIVGLIFIVLEAALDLKLTKEKGPLILKSFLVGLLGLVFTTAAIAVVLQFFLECTTLQALFYATPLGIISSAIVIPSVHSLHPYDEEFMVYDSTFSDILGIMLFFALEASIAAESRGQLFIEQGLNVFLTIVVAVIVSFLLIYVFQKITTKVKLFLLVAVLILMYGVGKLFHLSSLLIILIFGLILNNYKLFLGGKLKRYFKYPAIRRTLVDFRLITFESAFTVRTFFFVIFGLNISVDSFLSSTVFLESVIILALIYAVRVGVLHLVVRTRYRTILTVAPRGLITILLFYSIPKQVRLESFDQGVLMYVIIVSSLIMTFGLLASNKREGLFDLDGIAEEKEGQTGAEKPSA